MTEIAEFIFLGVATISVLVMATMAVVLFVDQRRRQKAINALFNQHVQHVKILGLIVEKGKKEAASILPFKSPNGPPSTPDTR